MWWAFILEIVFWLKNRLNHIIVRASEKKHWEGDDEDAQRAGGGGWRCLRLCVLIKTNSRWPFSTPRWPHSAQLSGVDASVNVWVKTSGGAEAPLTKWPDCVNLDVHHVTLCSPKTWVKHHGILCVCDQLKWHRLLLLLLKPQMWWYTFIFRIVFIHSTFNSRPMLAGIDCSPLRPCMVDKRLWRWMDDIPL